MDDQQPAGEGAEDTRVATGYQEPDVVLYSSDNDDILRRLSANDPAIAGLKLEINDGFEEERFDRIGFAIGNSTFLRKLEVFNNIGDEITHDLSPLFSRIAENRSVEHFALHGFGRRGIDIIPILAPFFVMIHNLRCLSITDSDISTSMPILISSLLQSKSNQLLERINFCHNSIEDEQGADFINALIANCERHRLVDLCLSGNHGKKACCLAIGELLTHPSCKIQTLDLSGNHNFDDGCMTMLLHSLAKNNSIKDLYLDGESNVGPSGWIHLHDVLSNPLCSVETLVIAENNFDEYVTWPLGHDLASNKSLRFLDISYCMFVNQYGWRGLSICLLSPDCALEELHIDCTSIEDNGAYDVFSSLSKNNTLKKFSMANNTTVEPEGWTNCFRKLLDSHCVLEELDLSTNNIDDAGVSVLTHLLNYNLKTVVTLNIHNNSSITSHGWCAFFHALFKDSNSNLKELYIGTDVGEPTIDDTVLIWLAKALEGNSKLTTLGLGRTNISTRGWNILTKALCDISSIDGLYSYSNHTLQKITCSQDIPPIIDLLLQTTNLHGKMTARVKVIVFMLLIHKDSISRLFGPMPVSILPSVIAWMGKDHSGFGALYSLVRSVPALLENV